MYRQVPGEALDLRREPYQSFQHLGIRVDARVAYRTDNASIVVRKQF